MNTERFSDSKPFQLYDPATTLTAALVSNVIDTQFYNSMTGVIDLIISAGSLDSITWEESADNVTWVAVPADDGLAYPDNFPYSADALVLFGCVAKERYVRSTLNCTTPTGTAACVGVKQDSLTKPMEKESSVLADADIISPSATADADTTPAKRP